MHCLALRTGAKPRYRYTDPGLQSGASPEQIWDTIQTCHYLKLVKQVVRLNNVLLTLGEQFGSFSQVVLELVPNLFVTWLVTW